MIRPLDEQFGPLTVRRIREIVGRLERIPFPDSATRYYSVEVIRALEAGILPGALSVCASLLEIAVRGLVMMHASGAGLHQLDLQAMLEERKEVGFGSLVDALASAGLFDRDDRDRAKAFYRDVRIPIQHGLPKRFLRLSSCAWQWDLRALLRRGAPVESGELEELLDGHALGHIETVTSILERNCV